MTAKVVVEPKQTSAGKDNSIMLRKKEYIEQNRSRFEKNLATRLTALQSEGLTDMQIQRDPIVRHFRGEIRRSKCRLASIAQVEGLMARKAEIKAEKLAAPKVDQPRKRHAADPEKKKARMERKLAASGADEE
jgi:hypothetical protein